MDTHITKDYLEGHIDRAALPADVEKTRKVPFVISTSAKDRHSSRLNMKNWDLTNFNRNPIVGYQHNVYGDNMCVPPNPDDILGPARAWVETKNGVEVLMGEVTFETADINPLAEKIFQKVLNGTLRATSVGFLETGKGKTVKEKDPQGRDIEVYHFEGQELLEFSIVNIPSNPEATRKVMVNHARAGVSMLNRIGLPVKEIRKIVNGILDAIEDNEPNEVQEVQTESAEPKADPKVEVYKQRLLNIKSK
jgi:prohead serine protease